MSFVEEIIRHSTIFRYYKIDSLNNRMDSVKWISDIRKIPGITTDWLYYSDLINQSGDEDSGSIVIDAETNLDSLISILKGRTVHSIKLIGKYYDKSVLISVNLSNYLIGIGIDRKQPVDYESLEKNLNLV